MPRACRYGEARRENGGRQIAAPTGCGIGLTDLLSIGLAPAFLIRRFAPPSPRGKVFRGAEGELDSGRQIAAPTGAEVDERTPIGRPYGVRGSLDRGGIGLTDLPSIGLAPAFLIRRFAPPSPRGKVFLGAEGKGGRSVIAPTGAVLKIGQPLSQLR